MHMKSVSFPVYKEILLDLQRRIRHGFYGVSGRLPSRRELCGIYGVSEMTAYRVQTQLEKEGFARREKGRGVFARASEELPDSGRGVGLVPPRRIFIFGMRSAFSSRLGHNRRMTAGAERRAAELGLETCRAFLDDPAASEIPGDTDGILLLVLNLALSGVVLLTIAQDTAKRYSEIMVISIAAYTFYKITMAVVNR